MPPLEPGAGQLDLGVVASDHLVGGSARVDWRLSGSASVFALGELGYSPSLGSVDWLARAGFRLTW